MNFEPYILHPLDDSLEEYFELILHFLDNDIEEPLSTCGLLFTTPQVISVSSVVRSDGARQHFEVWGPAVNISPQELFEQEEDGVLSCSQNYDVSLERFSIVVECFRCRCSKLQRRALMCLPPELCQGFCAAIAAESPVKRQMLKACFFQQLCLELLLRRASMDRTSGKLGLQEKLASPAVI